MSNVLTSGMGAQASLPRAPAYELIDSRDPDGAQAIRIANDIITHCSDQHGQVMNNKLTRVMDMVVKYIQDKTNVLPSVVINPPTSSPVNNNPTNPDQWDWNRWEESLFEKVASKSTRDLQFTTRKKIFSVLGGNTGNGSGKVIEIFQHPLFKQSLPKGCTHKVDNCKVKCFVETSQSRDQIFENLILPYEGFGSFKPTGMIKAAIALGYLPKEDIVSLYELPSTQR